MHHAYVASVHEEKSCLNAIFVTTPVTRNHIHVLSVHEEKKPFKCDICDCSCSQKSDMNRHVHEEKSLMNVTFVTTAFLKKVTSRVGWFKFVPVFSNW